MTPDKKRSLPTADLQELHDSIKDALLTVKAGLGDTKEVINTRPLVDQLHRVAALAETFAERRPKSNKNWIELADSLDREGVNLWNSSGLNRLESEGDGRVLSASLKLAGFRLIEAGLEQKPKAEILIHVLQMASKAGCALSEIGKNDVAASLLGCAAKYEESLRGLSSKNPADSQQHGLAIARATCVYYASRMEAAWREGNDGVAQFMLQKLTDNEQTLSQLRPHDREHIAYKVLNVGRSKLQACPREAGAITDGAKVQESIKWLQKAFMMVERLDESRSSSSVELKRSILRSLARAYFLSSSHDPENLNRAETSLAELIASVDSDSSANHASSEYQQLRWMRLAVLKRRKAPDSQLLEAFESIVDHMKFTEPNLTDILQELRTLSAEHTLVTVIHSHCLRRALDLSHDRADAELACVDRLLLSLIHHCSKDADHAEAMKDLDGVFQRILEADYELPKVSAVACLTLLWQIGDRLYHAKKWSEAADWFLAGDHQVFRNVSHLSSAKCNRKAALCHIQSREYAKAYTIIRRCPSDEATTHYVVFLATLHQGLEEEASRAVSSMIKASGFDRRMLLLATQLAHESDMKRLLLHILESLLKTLQNEGKLEAEIEAFTIIRCTVRLVLKLLAEPAADRNAIVETLIRHLNTAKSLFDAAINTNGGSLVAKDVSWLWRVAYNSAVQGCSEWEEAEDQVSDLFDLSRELLEAYCRVVLVDVDANLYLHIINASFAAIAGRVFSIRQVLAMQGSGQNDRILGTIEDIDSRIARIEEILETCKIQEGSSLSRIHSFIHILRVFETELLCHVKDWVRLMHVVEVIVRSETRATHTFEAIADILWVETDCPVDVLSAVLEAILHASLDQSALSLEKFSRWLRAICTILLSRNTAADRTKAIGYVEQAVTVLENHGGDLDGDAEAYPVDERQWLLGTSYNTGIECLQFVPPFICLPNDGSGIYSGWLLILFYSASMLDEAKRWFEASTVVCRFVPDGQVRAEKVQSTSRLDLISSY